MRKPYYQHGGITIYHGDAREVLPDLESYGVVFGAFVYDPPWDNVPDVVLPVIIDSLVFTDARRIGDAIHRFGAPAWLFTWDTMSPWNTGPRRPLQQTKHCLWYGELDSYARDGQLWGEPPAAKDHPSTQSTPLSGRRLVDLWSESLRWLHHPGAGDGSAGTERFSERASDPVFRHAKPLGWITCLLANCSSGLILDPFMGSGTTLRAAKDLGRRAIGVDISERACEVAADRLAQEVLAL